MRKGQSFVISFVAFCTLVACSKTQDGEAPNSSAVSASTSATAGLAVGKPAPDFDVRDQNGKPVQLAALRGKHVVLYFYPKDETAGCTKEAQAFRDVHEALTAQGATIIGVSTDSDESHRAFAQNHGLPFSLVSDPDGALAAKYEVPVRLSFASRQTFVIAPDGTLKKIYRDVSVDGHAMQVAADVADRRIP